MVFLHPFQLNGTYIEKYRVLLPSGLTEYTPEGPESIDQQTLQLANKRIKESPNWFKKKIAEFQKSQILSKSSAQASLAQEGDIYSVLTMLKNHATSQHR